MEQNFEEPVSRVRNYLAESKLPIELVSISQTTATAVQAAETLGVQVDQIGKSIAVGNTDSLFIVLLRGTAKVSVEKLSSLTGQTVKLLDKNEVLKRTGFKVGGVSPIGSLEKASVFMDSGLLDFETVWVAGGSPYSVFGCNPETLKTLTQAEVCDVTI
jgi:prolyl-tRNA editing enzyme YbaK/EbsC (Cys-tRNA(Pro) deacylase)